MPDIKEFATIEDTSTRSAEPLKEMESDKADFPGIHIFSSGTYNDKENPESYLASMVDFMQDHDNYAADLKIDHIDNKDDRDKKYQVFKNFPYSLGKIKNLETKEDSKKLFGDYIKVFEPIKKALNDKLLTTHSAEIYYNVTSKKTGKKYPAVLGAVALLPAGKMPALWSEFDPYMYEEENQNVKEFFTYEVKKNWSLDQQQINNNISEEATMPEIKNETGNDLTLAEMQIELDELKAFNLAAKSTMEAIKTEKAELKANYAAIELERKTSSVASFIDGLIESDQPKLLPAQREKAIYMLNAASQEKVNFSLDGVESESSMYELTRDFINSLPAITKEFLEKSIVAGDGVVVNNESSENESNDFSAFALDFVNSDNSDTHKTILEKAKEMELDLVGENKLENYAMSMEAVRLASPALFI